MTEQPKTKGLNSRIAAYIDIREDRKFQPLMFAGVQATGFSQMRGSALVYILIAIALLGALTMSFVEPSSQQGRAQNSYKLATEVQAQLETYRAAIQDCVIVYPAGDTSNAVKYAGYNEPYPVTPSSTYLPAPLRDAGEKASSMRCPGNPGNSSSHNAIFGSTTGRYAPKTNSLLSAMLYHNGTDGVQLYIGTANTDAYIADALQKVAAQYDACEAEYLSSCAAGAPCVRLWVKRNTTCP